MPLCLTAKQPASARRPGWQTRRARRTCTPRPAPAAAAAAAAPSSGTPASLRPSQSTSSSAAVASKASQGGASSRSAACLAPPNHRAPQLSLPPVGVAGFAAPRTVAPSPSGTPSAAPATCARRPGTDRAPARRASAQRTAFSPRCFPALRSRTSARRRAARGGGAESPTHKRHALFVLQPQPLVGGDVRVNDGVELRDFAAELAQDARGRAPLHVEEPGRVEQSGQARRPSAARPAARPPCSTSSRHGGSALAMAFTSEDSSTPVLPSSMAVLRSSARAATRARRG